MVAPNTPFTAISWCQFLGYYVDAAAATRHRSRDVWWM